MTKKKNIQIRLLWLGLIFLATACQEKFDHSVGQLENYLVVDGLLTTQEGPHGVRLSETTAYGEPRNLDRISDALVTISDDEGNEVLLEETSHGWYYTPNNFRGEVGKTYTLQIVTSDGYTYESAPQEIAEPIEMGNLDGEFAHETFYFESAISGRIYEDVVQGTKIYLETILEGSETPKFRYEAGLYLQYINVIPVGFINTYDYCWMVYDATEFLPRDIPDFSAGADFSHHQVGFLPYNTSDLLYLNLPDKSYDHNRTLISRLFALNQDAFEFHQAKNQQLSDEGKFFDPIAIELPSNMHCVNDPERRVYGIFEASSVTSFSVRSHYNSDTNELTLTLWEDPETIPEDGCSYEVQPPFWI